MQTDNKLFDDLARVANGAMGALTGARSEVESLVKARLERLLSDMDLVTRDEFDAVKAVAVKAREEQEALVTRVDALETALAAKPARKPRAKAKPGAKSPSKA
ncbi:MAG: accessory factor UbiK family protein [Alphaproteobacteria bacterium]|nr:accessory factor UbiK family protein [Alphaproteobacteria bacterium]